jgi:glycogen debranching enzyme
MKNNLIEQCFEESIKVLKKNSTNFGILACSASKNADKRNYLSIFARDASICALGMAASGDKNLIKAAEKSLLILAKYQAKNGQIPNYVKPEKKLVDFWKIGCIDANLWWLIAVYYFDKLSGGNLRLKLKVEIQKAISWLECQEHPEDKLLIQNEASDWADNMPRSGKTLYSNALWYWVKNIYNPKTAEETRKNFDKLFYPFDKKLEDIPRCSKLTVKAIKRDKRRERYYLEYVNFLFWGKSLDVFGNSLAIIFDLADPKKAEKIINIINEKNKSEMPIPALFYPIEKKSKYWKKYMENHNLNYPYQYHNGGVWPFISCFWAIALYKSGFKDLAFEELERSAKANKTNNWQFNEWFHAKTGKPMGMAGQSWNAGMFVLAYEYLKESIRF